MPLAFCFQSISRVVRYFLARRVLVFSFSERRSLWAEATDCDRVLWVPERAVRRRLPGAITNLSLCLGALSSVFALPAPWVSGASAAGVVADKLGHVCYPSRPGAGKVLVLGRGEAPSWVPSARFPVPSAQVSGARRDSKARPCLFP
ncbi:hypothetical protein NDU88_001716 [Pleurodeles waltl]|uniref:Transmembrane protein n=1 Tax=Pleurodeles waltl TaxID=8319 RepID=A0AAV7NBJ8_PLEWA|nr:hypothetical protein NDU88_001716 [Pleurodeles waltl]